MNVTLGNGSISLIKEKPKEKKRIKKEEEKLRPFFFKKRNETRWVELKLGCLYVPGPFSF